MRPTPLSLLLLGTGTSTGVPVVGCDCEVCRSSDPRNQRTRCSALIGWGDRNILIDPSTDLRQQLLREKITHIDAVLITHVHADHVHGIDDLRPLSSPGKPIPLLAAPEHLDSLRRTFRYIFDEPSEPGYRPQLQPQPIDGPFSLFGLPLTPVALPHGRTITLGFRFGPAAYLTDCSAVPHQAEDLLQGLELLVIDGLRHRPHPTHLNITRALQVAARLRVKRTLLTHLSHDVDHLRDSPALPPGAEFARDGQRVELFP